MISDKYSFGEEAMEYMKSVLRCGSQLSLALSHIDLSEGNIVSWLPIGTNAERVTNFMSGGTTIRQESLRLLTEIVVNALASRPGSVCILENPLSRPGDAYLRQLKIPYITNGCEVYFVLDRHASANLVYDALRTAYSYRLVGCIILLHESGDHTNTLEPILGSIAQTDEVYVGAYDGEGFLMWKRKSH
jgi:hypothetical protein